jgi:hypothetical protein
MWGGGDALGAVFICISRHKLENCERKKKQQQQQQAKQQAAAGLMSDSDCQFCF